MHSSYLSGKMSMLPPRSPSSHRTGTADKLTQSPSTSPSPSPTMAPNAKAPVILGVCAMDVKVRSKAMREILTRLVQMEQGGVDVKMFGDPVILEEGEKIIHRCRSLNGGKIYTIGPQSMSSSRSSPTTSHCRRLSHTRRSPIELRRYP